MSTRPTDICAVAGLQGVGVLGLGEAGAALAGGLVERRVRVCGWDPDPARSVPGVQSVPDPSDLARLAPILLSVNSSAAAMEAAGAVRGALTSAHLFVDANTSGPQLKLDLAALIEPTGAAFADAALMAPVAANGLRTRCIASGGGAPRFAAAFGAWGMPVEVLDGPSGAAANRKLLRSIVMKGLAAAVVEALAAAAACGCEEWLRAEIEEALTAADAALVDRLVTGSATHAVRRCEEMRAAAALESALGLEPHVAVAAAAVLRGLAAGGSPAVP